MKKFYILIVLAIFSLGVSAQSFTATNQFISGTPPYLLEGHITITNVSSTPKDVYVVRTVNNLAPNHDSYFCWVQCYASVVDTSPDFVTILPNGSFDLFRGDLDPYLNPTATSQVSYCFYDSNNINDSVCVEYNYPAYVGIADIPANRNYMSTAFPNPASDVTNFYINVQKNSKSAQLKFFNMLGSQVKEVDVYKVKNSVKVNVSDLKSGIYFYSLWVDGKSTSTGKLMISRN